MNKTEAEIRAFLKKHSTGSMSYNSIRASIIGSIGDYGFMSYYEAPDGSHLWFINGEPQQINSIDK
jgi:chlorite dismutase